MTFVGQEVPKCVDINPYGYPLDWADYCVDEKGEVVKRKIKIAKKGGDKR